MPLFITRFTISYWLLTVPATGNTTPSILISKHFSYSQTIVSPIRNQHLRRRQLRKQNIRTFKIASLPFAQMQPERRPAPSLRTCNLLFIAPKILNDTPDQAWLAALFEVQCRAVYLEMGGINHPHARLCSA